MTDQLSQHLDRSTGSRHGLIAAAGAMIGTDGPMAALGVVNPRSWKATDWLTDVVPHLGYGIVTAAVAQNLRGSL